MNLKWGDAIAGVRETQGVRYLIHSVNDRGAWGKGFVLALSKAWPEPERAYRSWQTRKLGEIQVIGVEPDLLVCNLVGQKGIQGPGNPRPVNYYAIKAGLTALDKQCPPEASWHMPRIGCGLGGGEWEEVERILTLFAHRNVTVYVV